MIYERGEENVARKSCKKNLLQFIFNDLNGKYIIGTVVNFCFHFKIEQPLKMVKN